MDALAQFWDRCCLFVCDFLLGWTLHLPWALAILILALLTVLCMLLLRRRATDQEWLGRAARDLGRQNELIREAKGRKDLAAVRRHRSVKGFISLRKMKAEVWPLLISLPPIAVLATWAALRLEWVPPEANRPLCLVATAPVTAIGEVMHVTPVQGLRAESGWIGEVVEGQENGQACGRVEWVLLAEPCAQPYQVSVRYRDRVYEHELLVGQAVYCPPLRQSAGQVTLRWILEEPRFLGLLPGIESLAIPSWMVTYLLLAILAYFVLRRALGVL